LSTECLTHLYANAPTSAEEFLDVIERSERHKIQTGKKRARFFGYCLGCKNKVLHTSRKHVENRGTDRAKTRVIYYFEHLAKLYTDEERLRMEDCEYYNPTANISEPPEVPPHERDEVKAELCRLAYGIWRYINIHILKPIGGMSPSVFIELAREVLARPVIMAGQGFVAGYLPYYLLSQLRGGLGTFPRVTSNGERPVVQLFGNTTPDEPWDYVHLPLLRKPQSDKIYEIRFVLDEGIGKTHAIGVVEVPLCDAYERMQQRQEDMDYWLGMSDDEFEEQLRSIDASTLKKEEWLEWLPSLRQDAKRIMKALNPIDRSSASSRDAA
jgi:hypothetical protein